LKELTLHPMPENIFRRALQLLFKDIRNLESLRIDFSEFSGISFDDIFNDEPSSTIKFLSLWSITDASMFRGILKKCTIIEKLDINLWDGLDESTLTDISRTAPNIQELRMFSEGKRSADAKFNSLKTLYFEASYMKVNDLLNLIISNPTIETLFIHNRCRPMKESLDFIKQLEEKTSLRLVRGNEKVIYQMHFSVNPTFYYFPPDPCFELGHLL